MRYLYLAIVLFTPFFASLAEEPTLAAKPLENSSYELEVSFPVASGDAIYADYLTFSVDNPDVELSKWQPSFEPIAKYDTRFKQTKAVFEKPFHVSMTAQFNGSPEDVHIHVASYSRSNQKNVHYKLPLNVQSSNEGAPQSPSSPSPAKQNLAKKTMLQSTAAPSFQEKVAALFTETESWGLRLLIALLLGLLLSFTPCIYPMIPITVGILQSQGSKSIGRNFLISCAYILGIATTFAALGTAAAFSGKMFGGFMKNPFVILSIIALIVYLAGSMIGLYDMYIPRFLQNNNQQAKNGSFLSIFLFGAASGTVASPCLSPGLVLLLTMVTALGNLFLGFILLFFFGIGLGLPLLAIGTFSGSLNMMPRAGTWMIDIKQFFGFIMLATCFYFLAGIMPTYIVTWGATIFSACVGVFYFLVAKKGSSFLSRLIKNLLGISFIALTIYLAYEAYKQTDLHFSSHKETIWLHDFDMAIAQAKQQHKKMIIDISAPYCSICKAIDKKIFADNSVQSKMQDYVAIKIDDIEATERLQEVQKKFNIIGAPTILVYDPETDSEIKRWGGELYEQSPEQFVTTLQ